MPVRTPIDAPTLVVSSNKSHQLLPNYIGGFHQVLLLSGVGVTGNIKGNYNGNSTVWLLLGKHTIKHPLITGD